MNTFPPGMPFAFYCQYPFKIAKFQAARARAKFTIQYHRFRCFICDDCAFASKNLDDVSWHLALKTRFKKCFITCDKCNRVWYIQDKEELHQYLAHWIVTDKGFPCKYTAVYLKTKHAFALTDTSFRKISRQPLTNDTHSDDDTPDKYQINDPTSFSDSEAVRQKHHDPPLLRKSILDYIKKCNRKKNKTRSKNQRRRSNKKFYFEDLTLSDDSVDFIGVEEARH